MRLARATVYTAATIASFADLALLYAVRAINDGRIASQTPPLLELPLGVLVAVYVALVAVVAVCWWLIRHNAFAGTFGKVALLIMLVFLMLRGVVIGYGFGNAPIDRARIAQTEARLGKVDQALQGYLAGHNGLPHHLEALGLPELDMQDAWGFNFEYSLDGDRLGYKVSAVGKPERLGDVQITRRFEKEPGEE